MSRFLEYLDRQFYYWECEAGICLPDAGFRIHVMLGLTLAFTIIGAASAFLLLRSRRKRHPLSARTRRVALVGLSPWALGAVLLAYGYFIEPRLLDVTHTLVTTNRLAAGTHLKIVLISDVHSEGLSHVMSRLPGLVAAEHPDLIFFGGDAVNSDRGVRAFDEMFGAMTASIGKYGVLGNHDLDDRLPKDLLKSGGLIELNRVPRAIADGSIILCGAPFDRPGDALACLDEAAPGYHIVIYHSPDIVEDAAARGADLVLAGHTHGGQIRVPYYGALITMSSFDKKYESGVHQVGDATLYVTRGIGQAEQPPTIRLFCPPELSVIEVTGTGPADAKLRSARSLGRNPETHLPYGLE